jgi:hypothetical protein
MTSNDDTLLVSFSTAGQPSLLSRTQILQLPQSQVSTLMDSSHEAREGPAESTIGPTAGSEEAGTLNQRPARAANAGAL